MFLLALILVACGGPTPSPAPTALLSPTPTAAPLPTPTPTPLPPVALTIRLPATISALEDVPIRVELPGLAERDPEARVRVWVSDPLHYLRLETDLQPAEGGAYVSPVLLHLPLESPPGEWRLRVFVLTDVPVSGDPLRRFQPRPVPLWDLRGHARAGIGLAIPRSFALRLAEGDATAGSQVWAGAGGEVGLWWAPGPAEPLSADTALMLLEATYPAEATVEVSAAAPLVWRGLSGFRFDERWPEGPGESWVLQGPDRWLYVLRVRALEGEAIPTLLREIQATFRVDNDQ